MLESVAGPLLYLISGFSLKLADDSVDLGRGGLSGFALAVLFGAAYSSASLLGSDFSAYSVGVVLACVAAGKVDAPTHLAGLSAFSAGYLATLLSGALPDGPVAIAAFASALVDEVVSDASDEGIISGMIGRAAAERPLLKLTALLLAAAGWCSVESAASVLLFDAAYSIAGRLRWGARI